jgi:hypothetical protein
MGPHRTHKNDGSLNLRPTQVNIFCMEVAPSNSDIVYGAAEGGGIFKSIDHALNWELISTDEVFTNAQDIKVHPTNANIVYVASNDDIYKTTDGGSTWNLMYTASGTVEQFYIHRVTPSKVYAATESGLFISNDSGVTWSLLYNKRCWDLVAHAVNPNILFLSVHNAAAKRAEVFKSTDAGITWTLKETGWYVPTVLASANDIGCKLGVTPADPNRIYACLIGDSKALIVSELNTSKKLEVINFDSISNQLDTKGKILRNQSFSLGDTFSPEIHDEESIFAELTELSNTHKYNNSQGLYSLSDAVTIWKIIEALENSLVDSGREIEVVL